MATIRSVEACSRRGGLVTTSTPSTARSSTAVQLVARFAVRRPLTAFLVLGMSLGYTLAFVWGLAYNGVIPGGGLADALHIAPDELVGAATLLALFPAALFVTWAGDGGAGVRSCCAAPSTGGSALGGG